MRKILIFLICFGVLFVCFVIPSFADESITPYVTSEGGSVPSDLTGYIVSVPSGWTASSGLGVFDLDYHFNSTSSYLCGTFAVGYMYQDSQYLAEANSIVFKYANSTGSYTSRTSSAFTLYISGGDDVDNPTLIDYLDRMHATFTLSTPETSVIPAGTYYFKEFPFLEAPSLGVWADEGYTYCYGIQGSIDTDTRVRYISTLYLEINRKIGNSNYQITFSVKSGDDIIDIAVYDTAYGETTLTLLNGFRSITFDEPFEWDYYDTEFIKQFLDTTVPGGDYNPDTDNPWLYIFDMIIQALNVNLFGYFSVWDVFSTIMGIYLAIWLLRLLAGG